VDIGGGDEVVSAGRLKPHLIHSPVQPAEPPWQGRPPASSGGRIRGQGHPPEIADTGGLYKGGGSVAVAVQEILQTVCS
jgi:hypothetical protein